MGLDWVSPPPIPGAPSFYFYIEDTLWTQLARDIRNSADTTIIWQAYCVMIDTGWGTYQASWLTDSIPAEKFWYSWTDMINYPETWTPLTEAVPMDITEDGRMFLMYKAEGAPTYCLDGAITLEGESDFSGTIVSITELGFSDTTDELGIYEICGIEAGTYEIIIEHEGYVTHVETLDISGDMIFNDTLNLMRYYIDGWVELEGLPAGSWDGTVVWLDDINDTTDTDGYFIFDNLLAGDYSINFEHEDYIPFDTIISLNDDVSLDITLQQFVNTGDICVIVTLEGSSELEGTQVVLDSTDTLYTDTLGQIIFSGLEYDDYILDISRIGYYPQSFYITLDSPAETIATELLLEFPDIGDIVVIVDLEGGGNLAGTEVVLGETVTDYTDEDGIVIFEEVEYGDYGLDISRTNFIPQSFDVTLDSPAETVSTMLSFQRGFIYGYVMLSDGPIDLSGSAVILDDDDTAYTDIAGIYSFDNVAYGEHQLQFEHDGYYSLDTLLTLDTPGTLAVDVMLEEIPPVLNPPQDLEVYSRHHDRIAIRWIPPEPSEYEIIGYGVIRSWMTSAGGDTIAILPPYTVSYIDPNVELNWWDIYWYSVYAIYDEGTSEAFGPRYGYGGDEPTDPDVLVIDFDNGALLADDCTQDEASLFATLFNDADNVIAEFTEQDENIGEYELLMYKAVFIITGVDDANDDMLSNNSCAQLLDYMGAGGRIYWEGADVAKDYQEVFGGALTQRMGISLADNGRGHGPGNVSELFGQTPFFFNNLMLQYDFRSMADHRVDEFYADPRALDVLHSQSDPAPIVSNIRMVAYDGSEPGDSSDWRTVTSSIYLGAIQWSDNVNNSWEVLRGIWYFLTGEDIGPSDVKEETKAQLPSAPIVKLSPTPFNSALDISIEIPNNEAVDIVIRDVRGCCIATIFTGELPEGTHSFRWNADDNPSGAYLVSVKTADGAVAKKAILVR